ncbi:trehalase-like isoform X3 [Zootermopsis nevadensis]|uniref:trehalase-like isoform X3 n=1 Tax=Zootermopsis nevadensis TaxID=136037 RepID=UPI000B8E4620|nr:trehalase-like isoform X3 [Zootermopsis nevadensis]
MCGGSLGCWSCACSMSAVCLVCGLLLALVCVSCLPPPCDSDIYCYGDLLHVVQMSNIFPDSKTFVDMKMKYSKNETWQSFRELMSRTDNNPNRTDIWKFVNETFDPPGSEFEDWDPVDWTNHPKFLDKIKDPDLQEWARHLHHFWKKLGRKMKDEVRDNEELYSIIYVQHPVIVPGGRFRELYYWDSYWIVRGLLLSEMYGTVRGMLENFLGMVKKYGFIPNGGRIYYLRRSQPPLLIPMVKSYLDATKDIGFLSKNIGSMEEEFQYWMKNHSVTVAKDGKSYSLARYSAPSSGPRPESYREDYENTRVLITEAERQDRYTQLKTAAESGWDFSTRWYITNSTDRGDLSNTMTQHIVPVELNAILYWNALLLSEFFDALDMPNKTVEYRHLADSWLEAVDNVLWHDEMGIWLDYDLINGIKRNYFYPTNLAPLWTGCFKRKKLQVGKIMKYLERSQIMMFLGGIPTSLEHSGEQWDYPNAWPPLQYIVIMALEATEDIWAQNLAVEVARRWVRSNFKAFNESHVMYEKYDATFPGGHGSGGEYENQIGFGWTNGVILELLGKYNELTVADSFFSSDSRLHHKSGSSSLLVHVMTLIVISAAVFLL